MHEGKHGILDDLDDMDELFGDDEEETAEKEKDPHGHNHDGHQPEHDQK